VRSQESTAKAAAYLQFFYDKWFLVLRGISSSLYAKYIVVFHFPSTFLSRIYKTVLTVHFLQKLEKPVGTDFVGFPKIGWLELKK
jgi:hypothetical protein